MSEQTKFTPMTWEWITTNGDRGRIKGKPIRQCLWNKELRKGVLAPDYTEINGEGVWETWIAVNDDNARLIAAAPELLSALRHALEDLEQLNVGHASIEDVCGIIPEIRNVLHKATGN